MRKAARAMAVVVSLAASVLLLQGSVLGAAPGSDQGRRTMTLPRGVLPVQLHRPGGTRPISSGRDRLP
jgi:hypothetical protein